MASVDVIVPCYNYGRFLRECVGSVLSQEGVEIRVLVIDDCSTDDSADVARALAGEDPRVEVRRHEKNRGHIATYNEGLEWIAADYTLLLSADDLLTAGALRRAADFLDAHPEVGFVYGKVIRWVSGQPLPPSCSAWGGGPARVIPGRDWIEQICTGDPPTTSPELVVRTSLQRQLGAFRQDLPHWGDVEMLMRFAAHAPVGQLDCVQAYYRIHSMNMHQAYRGLNDLMQRRITFQALFGQFDQLLPRSEELKSLAFRHIAETAIWSAGKAFEQSDLPTCRSLCDFATETYPPIASWPVFRRLRRKMLLGRRTFGIIRYLWKTIVVTRQPFVEQRTP